MAPPKTKAKSSTNITGCTVEKTRRLGRRTYRSRLRLVMAKASLTTHAGGIRPLMTGAATVVVVVVTLGSVPRGFGRRRQDLHRRRCRRLTRRLRPLGP